MRFRYDTGGRWFKGNTHLHTTASDGVKSREQVAAMYRAAGYDFIFITDHWIAARGGLVGQDPLLVLGGIELDGVDRFASYYHVVCLGEFTNIKVDMGFEAALESARAQDGLLILAHPHWSGNSIEEALRYNFHGVEIYSAMAHWMNGKCWGLYHWDAVLERLPGVLGFAVDDTHFREEAFWNRGWIWVNALELTPHAIREAILQGNFCSSTGPQIFSLAWKGDLLQVQSSPVKCVRIVGAGPQGTVIHANGGKSLTEYELRIPQEYKYVRLEIEDAQGRCCWSNSLFV